MKALLILTVAAILLSLGPAQAFEINLPDIDPGAAIWHDFDTGLRSLTFTATTPVGNYKEHLRFNGGLTLPTNLERLDFGFLGTVKFNGRFEIGIGTRDWFKKPGAMLRYSF